MGRRRCRSSRTRSLFLFLPAGSVLIGAFQDKSDDGYTFSNVRLLFNHPYIDAY